MGNRDYTGGRALGGWLSCLACAALCGCGGPNLGRVTGRVLVGGVPVTQGRITFHHETGRPAVGEIGSDGTYTLTTFDAGDGALVGAHRVAIQATRVGTGSLAAPRSLEAELELSRKGAPGGKVLVAGKVEWLVPEKFSRPDTSGLARTVGRGANEINFDLPAGK